jgi:hypothetical protein
MGTAEQMRTLFWGAGGEHDLASRLAVGWHGGEEEDLLE